MGIRNLKDAKKRIFLKKIVTFLPYAGALGVAFPAYGLISSELKNRKKLTLKLNELTYDVTKKGGFFIIKNGKNLKAFSTTCTHLGCSLNFDSLHQKFVCPCHKSEFSLEGKVLKGPAKRDLEVAQVNIENGKVELTL